MEQLANATKGAKLPAKHSSHSTLAIIRYLVHCYGGHCLLLDGGGTACASQVFASQLRPTTTILSPTFSLCISSWPCKVTLYLSFPPSLSLCRCHCLKKGSRVNEHDWSFGQDTQDAYRHSQEEQMHHWEEEIGKESELEGKNRQTLIRVTWASLVLSLPGPTLCGPV